MGWETKKKDGIDLFILKLANGGTIPALLKEVEIIMKNSHISTRTELFILPQAKEKQEIVIPGLFYKQMSKSTLTVFTVKIYYSSPGRGGKEWPPLERNFSLVNKKGNVFKIE